MAPAQHVELDLASPFLQRHRGGHRSRRQRRLEALELLQVRLGLLEARLETSLRLGVRGPHDVVFELLDLGREQRSDLLLDERNAAEPRVRPGQILLRPLRGHHFEARVGLRVRLVALPVIEMEMGVDHLADGLGGDPLDFLVERAGGRRLGVGIDHHDAIVRHDDGGIAVDLVSRRRDRRVQAVAHLPELEELLVGRLGVGWHGTTELVRIEGVDGGSRDPHLRQHLSTRPWPVHRVPSVSGFRLVRVTIRKDRGWMLHTAAPCRASRERQPGCAPSITAAGRVSRWIDAIRGIDAPRWPRPAEMSCRCAA